MLVKQWWRDDHGGEPIFWLDEVDIHFLPIPVCCVVVDLVSVWVSSDDEECRLIGDDSRVPKSDWQVRPWKRFEIVSAAYLTFKIVGLTSLVQNCQ